MFHQAMENLLISVDRTKNDIRSNNYLAVANKSIHKELIEFLEELEKSVVGVVDLSNRSDSVQKDTDIRAWVVSKWPEFVEKLNEYTSKKALAEMLVPTGIVACCGIAAVVIGGIFDVPPVVAFGTGSFIGMFATRQVHSKTVSNRIEKKLNQRGDDQDESESKP